MLNTFKLTTSKQLMKPKKSINLDSMFVKYGVACHLIFLSILQVACHFIVIHSYFEQWFYWNVFCILILFLFRLMFTFIYKLCCFVFSREHDIFVKCKWQFLKTFWKSRYKKGINAKVSDLLKPCNPLSLCHSLLSRLQSHIPQPV